MWLKRKGDATDIFEALQSHFPRIWEVKEKYEFGTTENPNDTPITLLERFQLSGIKLPDITMQL